MNWGTIVEKMKESGFSNTVLPEGNYEAEVTKAEVRKSKAGAHQVMLTYNVTEGPYQGEELVDFLTFSDKAAGFAGQKIEAVAGPDFFTKLVQDYGTEINEHALKVVASVFDGKHLDLDVTVAKDGKSNFISVLGVTAGVTAPTPPVLPTPAAPPLSTPANPYAAPPAVNPNLPV